jgi:hypothetical protein
MIFMAWAFLNNPPAVSHLGLCAVHLLPLFLSPASGANTIWFMPADGGVCPAGAQGSSDSFYQK